MHETSSVTMHETSSLTIHETSSVTIHETSSLTIHETSSVTIHETSSVITLLICSLYSSGQKRCPSLSIPALFPKPEVRLSLRGLSVGR